MWALEKNSLLLCIHSFSHSQLVIYTSVAIKCHRNTRGLPCRSSSSWVSRVGYQGNTGTPGDSMHGRPLTISVCLSVCLANYINFHADAPHTIKRQVMMLHSHWPAAVAAEVALRVYQCHDISVSWCLEHPPPLQHGRAWLRRLRRPD